MVYINRGRDVHMLIQQEGERGLRKAVIKLAEDNTHMHMELKELRELLARLLDLVGTLQGVAMVQHDAMKAIEQKFRPNNEANPDQSWLGDKA